MVKIIFQRENRTKTRRTRRIKPRSIEQEGKTRTVEPEEYNQEP